MMNEILPQGTPETTVESLLTKVQKLEIENRRLKEKIDIDLPQLSEGYTVNPNDEPLFVKSLDMGEKVYLQISKKERRKFKDADAFEIILTYQIRSSDELAATLLFRATDHVLMKNHKGAVFFYVEKESNRAGEQTVHVIQKKGGLAGIQIEVTLIKQAHGNSISCDNNASVEVEIGNEKILVDIPYVSKWSHFFRAYFECDMSEKSSGVYAIHDCSATDFRVMLEVIYPYSKPIDEFIVEKMLELGDRFIMPMLKRKCEIFLSGFKMDDIQKIELADRFNLASIREIVLLNMKSVEDIVTNIIKTDKYENLSPEMKRAIQSRFFQLSIQEKEINK